MKTKILLCASLSVSCAYGASDQTIGASLYAGYTPNVLQSSNVAPYGPVVASDLYPLVVGYGLTQIPNPLPPAYVVNQKNGQQYQPNIVGLSGALSPTQLLVGSMLNQIPDNSIATYQQQMEQAFEPPSKATITSSTSFGGSQAPVIADYDPSGYTYYMSPQFIAPYDAASLFTVPTAFNNAQPAVYQTDPGSVYMSLVSGALVPQPIPADLQLDKPAGQAYMLKLRRYVAMQTAGVHALEEIYKDSQPLPAGGFDAKVLSQLNAQFPAEGQTLPSNKRELEKFMATRRLDPSNGWYAHLQQASSVELQREQLYLQAEMLYELYQVHQDEEENKLLLAISLLNDNYNSRGQLNQIQKITEGSKKTVK